MNNRRFTSIQFAGKPITLAFHPDEWTAIEAAALRRNLRPMRMMRLMLEAFGETPEDLDVAAAAAHMTRAAWMRVVVLEALGITDIGRRAARAAQALRERPTLWTDPS